MNAHKISNRNYHLQSQFLPLAEKAKKKDKFDTTFKDRLVEYIDGVKRISDTELLGKPSISTSIAYYFDISGRAVENYADAQREQIKTFLVNCFPSLEDDTIDEAINLSFIQNKLRENKIPDQEDTRNLTLWCKQQLCIPIAIAAVRYGWHTNIVLAYKESILLHNLNHGENEDPEKLEKNLRLILGLTKGKSDYSKDALISFFHKIGLKFQVPETGAPYFDVTENNWNKPQETNPEEIQKAQENFAHAAMICIQNNKDPYTQSWTFDTNDLKNLFIHSNNLVVIGSTSNEFIGKAKIVEAIEKTKAYSVCYYNGLPFIQNEEKKRKLACLKLDNQIELEFVRIEEEEKPSIPHSIEIKEPPIQGTKTSFLDDLSILLNKYHKEQLGQKTFPFTKDSIQKLYDLDTQTLEVSKQSEKDAEETKASKLIIQKILKQMDYNIQYINNNPRIVQLKSSEISK